MTDSGGHVGESVAVIDLNVRRPGWREAGGTYVGFEDITGPFPTLGVQVSVVEPESGAHGHATVVAIDHASRLVYLDLNWAALSGGSPES